MHNIVFYSTGIVSHIFVLILLSTRRRQLSKRSLYQRTWLLPSIIIKLLGAMVAICTLTVPYLGPPDDPFQQCGVRVACFFYAFKLLDLALTRSDTPPKLLDDDGVNRQSILMDHVRYVWLLLTEMRYHALDIQAVQRGRPANNAGERWHDQLLPPLVIGGITYACPIAEMKCLLLLCIIQNGLEGVHTLLHSRCPHKLFFKPFSAATLGDFWTVHWHASAVFLQTLAYKPGQRLIGRWFGVLAAFALSGAWHGWASTPLVDDEHALQLGLKVWTFFFMLGVGSLIERVVWQDRQGGLIQRVVVWAWALLWAGWCFRTLECHSKIAFLRSGNCAVKGTGEPAR